MKKPKKSAINRIIHTIETLTMGVDPYSKLAYFGEFLLFVNLRKTNQISTMGVSYEEKPVLSPVLYWNEQFVDRLNFFELLFTLLHEVFHLLSDHWERGLKLESKEIFNQAADVIVNEMIINEILKYDLKDINLWDKCTKDFQDILYRTPEKYCGVMQLEHLYYWLLDQKEKYDDYKEKKKGISNGDKNQNEKLDKQIEQEIGQDLKKQFDNMGNPEKMFDEPIDIRGGKYKDEEGNVINSKFPKKIRKMILEDIKNNLKHRGLETGTVSSILEGLKKSKTDYTKKILTALSNGFGIKNSKTFIRPNRRNIKGLKGYSKQFKELVVLLDTSGSMNGYFEKALSFIFRNNINIHLVQGDTEVKNVYTISSLREFKKITISGFGGTELQPIINFIEKDSKLGKLNILTLTDGWTDKLCFKKAKKVIVLSNDRECPISSNNVSKIEQIIIKDFIEE